jgi:hypothetical protein
MVKEMTDHFHVHIVHVSQTAAGMNVGHAHLLDDIISLVSHTMKTVCAWTELTLCSLR